MSRPDAGGGRLRGEPTSVPVMFESRKKKRGLYYLLPGMNRSNRERQKQILRWAILFGLVTAALFGWLISWVNLPHVTFSG